MVKKKIYLNEKGQEFNKPVTKMSMPISPQLKELTKDLEKTSTLNFKDIIILKNHIFYY